MLPCFTPKELKDMGVYDESGVNYYPQSTIKPDEEEKQFLEYYKETGKVPSNYYEMVKERRNALIESHNSQDAMQRMLYVGWNPYVSFEAAKEVSEDTEERLFAEGYTIDGIDIIDITETSNREDPLTDEDVDIDSRGEFDPEYDYDE